MEEYPFHGLSALLVLKRKKPARAAGFPKDITLIKARLSGQEPPQTGRQPSRNRQLGKSVLPRLC